MLAIVVLLTGCATEHRPPAAQLRDIYIDCTNRVAFENYFNQQLRLTDFTKIEENSDERRYYAAIKDRLWTLRSTCK